jgi:hypothetical protein
LLELLIGNVARKFIDLVPSNTSDLTGATSEMDSERTLQGRSCCQWVMSVALLPDETLAWCHAGFKSDGNSMKLRLSQRTNESMVWLRFLLHIVMTIWICRRSSETTYNCYSAWISDADL